MTDQTERPEPPKLAAKSTWPGGNIVDWILYLKRDTDFLWRQIQQLQAQEAKTMADIDKLTADVTKYQSDVNAALAALQAEITNNPIPPAVQAKIDALDAVVNNADSGLPKTGP